MTCKRCNGYLYREDDGYTCLQCGRRVEDVKREPLDIPVTDRLHYAPRKKMRRAVR